MNNVETLVNIPLILAMGGEAYATIGTEGSTGPKLFCLSGHVERPGTYEVEFGATLRDLIDLAGGVSGGRSTTRSRRSCSAVRPASSSGRRRSTCR